MQYYHFKRAPSLLFFFISVAILPVSAKGADVAAPFGFVWGPVDKIPKPSSAIRDANVTTLFYQGEQLGNSEMAQTDLILLDVCKAEGLQQISWASKSLSTEDAKVRFAQIVAEGTRQYGEGKVTTEGSLAWQAGQVEAISVSESDDKRRILMVSRGPGFSDCSKEHDAASLHPLRNRWLTRIEPPR